VNAKNYKGLYFELLNMLGDVKDMPDAIGGGFAMCLFRLKKSTKDIDLYYFNPISFNLFEKLRSLAVYETDKAFTLPSNIQIARFTGPVNILADSYDFSFNKIFYSFTEEPKLLYKEPMVYSDWKKKRCVYTGSTNPADSLRRLWKYMSEGFTVEGLDKLRSDIENKVMKNVSECPTKANFILDKTVESFREEDRESLKALFLEYANLIKK